MCPGGDTYSVGRSGTPGRVAWTRATGHGQEERTQAGLTEEKYQAGFKRHGETKLQQPRAAFKGESRSLQRRVLSHDAVTAYDPKVANPALLDTTR